MTRYEPTAEAKDGPQEPGLARRIGARLSGWRSAVVPAICIAGLFILWLRFADRAPMVGWTWETMAYLAASTLVYSLPVFGIAAAWRRLLGAVGGEAAYISALAAISVSHIGRYLPGSIGMYLSRAELTRRAGVGIGRSAVAMVAESAWAVAAGLIVLAATGLVLGAASLDFRLGLLAVLFLPALVALPFALRPLVRAAALQSTTLSEVARGLEAVDGRTAITCLLYYHLNFVLGGISLWLVFGALDSEPAITPMLCIFAFAAAWVGGFAAFGAPAGLGVREAILVGMVGPSIGVETAIAAALLHRIVTFAADVVILVGGWALLLLLRLRRSA